MASPVKRPRSDERNDTVCGYVHNVSAVKTAARTGNKFFNAVLQVSRDEYHNVVVFAAEKRTQFMQANKNQSPVKLQRMKRRVSTDGSEYDIQCGSSTDMSVARDLPFPFKPPPINYKKIGDVKNMAPKQFIAAVKFKVVHVTAATESVEVNGAAVELQRCYIADDTGHIELQLWEAQVGCLLKDHWYEANNLCTRDFAGGLYITTTRSTILKVLEGLSGPVVELAYQPDEGETSVLTGCVTAAEVNIVRRCSKCNAWQAAFDNKAAFYRCESCRLLQRTVSFEPSATARLVVAGDFGEEDVKLSNSVLKRHLEEEGLINLLKDRQSVEEHFFSMGLCALTMRKNAVTAVSKVQASNAEDMVGKSNVLEKQAVDMENCSNDQFEECITSEIGALFDESPASQSNAEFEQPGCSKK